MKGIVVLEGTSAKHLIELSTHNEDISIFYEESLESEYSNLKNASEIQVPADVARNKIRENFDRIPMLGHLNINGTKVRDYLKHKDYCYWYYIRFKLFKKTNILRQKELLLQQVIDKNPQTSEWIIIDNSNHIPLFKKYEDKKFSIIAPQSPENRKSPGKKIPNLMLFLLRSFLGCFSLPFAILQKYFIKDSPSFYRKITDPISGEPVFKNPYLTDIINLSKSYTGFGYISEINYPVNKGTIVSKLNIFNPTAFFKTVIWETCILLALSNPIIMIKTVFFRSAIKNKIKMLTKQLEQQDFFAEAEIISGEVNFLTYAYFRQQCVLWFCFFSRMRVMATINEFSIYNQPFVQVSKKGMFKSVGIQHGGLSAGNAEYHYIPEDIDNGSIPHLSLVRGEQSYELMQKNNAYPADFLKIVGHAVTDSIPAIKNKYGNTDKKIILIATQPNLDSEQGILFNFTKTIFETARNFPEYTFVFKLHPAETNLKFYTDIAENLHVKNYKIVRDDLYVWLAKSKIVITYFSTVGIEAIYFNKPLLVVDPLELDNQCFIKDKITVNSKNQEELTHNIRRILNDENIIRGSDRENFIKYRSHAIDGKSSKRHIEAIKSLGG